MKRSVCEVFQPVLLNLQRKAVDLGDWEGDADDVVLPGSGHGRSLCSECEVARQNGEIGAWHLVWGNEAGVLLVMMYRVWVE